MYISGWWLGHPSEKYSSIGMIIPHKNMEKWGFQGVTGYRSGGKLLCFFFTLEFEMFDCCFLLILLDVSSGLFDYCLGLGFVEVVVLKDYFIIYFVKIL